VAAVAAASVDPAVTSRQREPPLKLVLIEGTAGEPTRTDHLGVEVETTDEVTAATSPWPRQGW
jgi:hypothetical protein